MPIAAVKTLSPRSEIERLKAVIKAKDACLYNVRQMPASVVREKEFVCICV